MAAAPKRYRLGTHRVRDPEETWEWISPRLPAAGVTRVADVTALDRLGIPVYQAVRPASRNLSVSQGKAVTAAAARVSAAMEAVELWHAECLDHLPQAVVSLREMRYANPVDLAAFPWRPDSRRLDAAPMAWLRAESLRSDRPGWLPRQMVELDFTLPDALKPCMFHVTSNGLASGNCREEALLHALCELIERHGLYLDHTLPGRRIALWDDPEGLGYCGDLVRRMRQAGMKLALWDITWEAGVPVMMADLVAPDLPNVWRGSGCHPCPRVALSRALTEAAQARLTYIAGARDDLTQFPEDVPPSRTFDRFREPSPERRLEEVGDLSTSGVTEDLDRVVDALARIGFEPFFLDLTRPEVGVPVVVAFVPGLREAPYG